MTPSRWALYFSLRSVLIDEWSVEQQRRASAGVDAEFASNFVQFGIDDRNLARKIKGHDHACSVIVEFVRQSERQDFADVVMFDNEVLEYFQAYDAVNRLRTEHVA